jgi:phospholipid/cholesterol/gamma-HCH transport system substrate-binding protein
MKTRAVAWAALAAAAATVSLLLAGGGSPYIVHADFADAGQLVSGDLVEVGGLPIGSIDTIGVTPDGQADISMNIADQRFVPLHSGTLASIRAVGAAGIANRYVAIDPGPGGAATIPNGGVLPPTASRGIVDLDMLLDSLDKPTRDRLVAVISGGATALGAPRSARADFRLLDPAVSQTSLLAGELLLDQPALSNLIASTATTFHALDSPPGDLERAVVSLSGVLEAIAGQRAALADALSRTTDVLSRIRVTLRGLRATLPAVGTMLADARPLVAPLIELLGSVVADAPPLASALASLRAQLPPTLRALAGFPVLSSLAVTALRTGQSAITGLTPIVAGLRPYTADWMAGPVTQIGSVQYAYYDQLGHYARETILGGQASLSGILSLFPHLSAPSPRAPSYRTGLEARCPGGAAEPASDRSNPWVPDPRVCNPQDDHK